MTEREWFVVRVLLVRCDASADRPQLNLLPALASFLVVLHSRVVSDETQI